MQPSPRDPPLLSLSPTPLPIRARTCWQNLISSPLRSRDSSVEHDTQMRYLCTQGVGGSGEQNGTWRATAGSRAPSAGTHVHPRAGDPSPGTGRPASRPERPATVHNLENSVCTAHLIVCSEMGHVFVAHLRCRGTVSRSGRTTPNLHLTDCATPAWPSRLHRGCPHAFFTPHLAHWAFSLASAPSADRARHPALGRCCQAPPLVRGGTGDQPPPTIRFLRTLHVHDFLGGVQGIRPAPCVSAARTYSAPQRLAQGRIRGPPLHGARTSLRGTRRIACQESGSSKAHSASCWGPACSSRAPLEQDKVGPVQGLWGRVWLRKCKMNCVSKSRNRTRSLNRECVPAALLWTRFRTQSFPRRPHEGTGSMTHPLRPRAQRDPASGRARWPNLTTAASSPTPPSMATG